MRNQNVELVTWILKLAAIFALYVSIDYEFYNTARFVFMIKEVIKEILITKNQQITFGVLYTVKF